jgi:tRNA-splicing ligase RtcB (3'-phosphate/5'-hydroxy nucleic acid ligase)
MSIAEIKGEKVTAKLWLPIHEVESGALDQIRNVASLPWTEGVAVMPDCHQGIGSTVGTVLATRGAVVPSVIGGDPGCGMEAVLTDIPRGSLPRDLGPLRAAVEAAIPVGFMGHGDLPDLVKDKQYDELWDGVEHIALGVTERLVHERPKHQLGTLGSGNHFIELCVDEEARVWMLLHSGSRNMGKCIAEYHIHVARGLEHNKYLKDRALGALLAGTPEFDSYWHDLKLAQQYAAANRTVMVELYRRVLEQFFGTVDTLLHVSCHHNYSEVEEHGGESLFVSRKGAIRAAQGQWGIIPGAMGKDARSYIVTGLGNTAAYLSAPHGAGRAMSRGDAKRRFTVADLEAVTAGVECRKDKGVLDEIQGAYKPISTVMANAADLVKPVHELRALLCVKG